MKVGVVGLGLMGGAMAARLVEAGHETSGYDIGLHQQAAARDRGVTVVDSVAAVLDGDAVLLSLPSAQALDDVGRVVASHPGEGTLLIETSTLSLESKLRFGAAARSSGFDPLDCPVSGGAVQARSAEVTFFASGDPGAIERAMPLLRTLSRQQVLAGEYGNGTKLKLVANHLVAIHNLATAEALLLARRAGLELRAVVPAISASSATSVVFDIRGRLIADAAWADPARQSTAMTVPVKDNELIDALAQKFESPTPLLDATRAFYRSAIAQGRAREDPAALFAVLEQLCANANSAAE